MKLPPKRKPPRSGIKKAARRTFMVHQAFVRRHGCAVPGCASGPTRLHHVKTRGAGGGDEYGVGFCDGHHTEIHTIGLETFQGKYGIDLWALAAEFTRRSPDKAMRESLALVNADG